MLAADIEQQKQNIISRAKAENEDRERQEKWGAYSPSIAFGPPHNPAASEKLEVSERSMLPMKAVLLLRLGEGELAGEFSSQWDDAPKQNPPLDPYTLLSIVWLSSAYGRALDAHARGDEHVAAACARTILQVKKAMDAASPKQEKSGEQADPAHEVYDIQKQMAQLLADCERRIAAGPYTPWCSNRRRWRPARSGSNS